MAHVLLTKAPNEKGGLATTLQFPYYFFWQSPFLQLGKRHHPFLKSDIYGTKRTRERAFFMSIHW